MIKYCQNCYEKKEKLCSNGYSWCWKDDVRECPHCKSILVDIDFPALDLKVIEKISNEKSFIEAMIELKEKDPIEFQLKMSQFKTQTQQQESIKAQSDNKPKCPTCGSTKLSKVSTASKANSVFMWGLLSQKVKKTWHCDNCKYEW